MKRSSVLKSGVQSLSDADLDCLCRHPELWINLDSLSAIRRLGERAPGREIGLRINPGLGVGYWTDGNQERIVYVTRGYSMFSLDAKTGLPDPHFGNNGMVDLRLGWARTVANRVGAQHFPPSVSWAFSACWPRTSTR